MIHPFIPDSRSHSCRIYLTGTKNNIVTGNWQKQQSEIGSGPGDTAQCYGPSKYNVITFGGEWLVKLITFDYCLHWGGGILHEYYA